MRATTAPEATPSASPASPAVKFQTPPSAAMPRRRSVRPSALCRDLVGHAEVAAAARSTTMSTLTVGGALRDVRSGRRRARSPPQPKSGCSDAQDRRHRRAASIDASASSVASARALATLPGDAAPAHGRAEHVGAAGIDACAHRPAGPEDAAAEVARAQPRARRRGRASAPAARARCLASRRCARRRRRPGRPRATTTSGAARSRRRRRADRGRRGCSRRRAAAGGAATAGARAPRARRLHFGRQRCRLDAQLAPRCARALPERRSPARSITRPDGVDAVERERRLERRVGLRADLPAALGAGARASVWERRPAPCSFAAGAAAVGQRPEDALSPSANRRSCDERAVRSRHSRWRAGRVSAEPRREAIERRRIDRELPIVGARCRAPRSVPVPAPDCRRRRGRTTGRALPVAVDKARAAFDGDAGERASGAIASDAGAARVAAERVVERQAGCGVASGDRTRLARRVGSDGARVANRRCPATTARGRSRPA